MHMWLLQDFSKEEKRALAIQSRKAPPKYGSEAKQQIIDGLHARMLASEQVALQSSLCADVLCLCSLQQPLPEIVWICCLTVFVGRPRAPQVELSLQHPCNPSLLEFRKLRQLMGQIRLCHLQSHQHRKALSQLYLSKPL